MELPASSAQTLCRAAGDRQAPGNTHVMSRRLHRHSVAERGMSVSLPAKVRALPFVRVQLMASSHREYQRRRTERVRNRYRESIVSLP